MTSGVFPQKLSVKRPHYSCCQAKHWIINSTLTTTSLCAKVFQYEYFWVKVKSILTSTSVRCHSNASMVTTTPVPLFKGPSTVHLTVTHWALSQPCGGKNIRKFKMICFILKKKKNPRQLNVHGVIINIILCRLTNRYTCSRKWNFAWGEYNTVIFAVALCVKFFVSSVGLNKTLTNVE